MKIKYIFFVLILLFNASCGNNQERITKKIVTEWSEKEIKIPSDIKFSNFLSNTIPHDILNKKFKILLYIDSFGCTDCRFKYYMWDSIIDEAKSISHDNVGFIFVILPKNNFNIERLLKQQQLNYPVIIDKKDILNKLNKFPEEQKYQCFLLNKSNKVLLIGDPFINPNIWDLYKMKICE